MASDIDPRPRAGRLRRLALGVAGAGVLSAITVLGHGGGPVDTAASRLSRAAVTPPPPSC
ncbi:MAG: hypothetical protein WCB51_09085 [Candidatus Dormiibacterota bacterium]